MAEFTVYLKTFAETVVKVDADDADEALDKAYDASMPTICAQCSGWGRDVNLELGDVWEADSVTNEAGEVVWEDKPARQT